MSYEWEEYILDLCEPPADTRRCCECLGRACDLPTALSETPDLWICTECLAETEALEVNEVGGAATAA